MKKKITENSFEYYALQEDTKPVAHIGYSLLKNEQTYLIEHTWVNPSFRGSGLAEKITTDFLNKVNNEGYKVILLCPFTKSFFKNHDEYQHLLTKLRGED
ncbi:GNAT family N-acetyltransferase [Liquorilactobacillus cacaonum]|uniref:Uncharacterized protein n=1 Tax=Liquorilactobacillus cacaonum DSM 21116 TaxID=1423729 RepID=A0A0R2CQJ9_9LACO|nr:GNAT family N-acetyltransferase [Liquorilactobacillus cacaonum]KRM90476.1 hypothetical protein FC80_GL001381 [Liquorilactobacillus cacaonum DSM 21116]